MAYADPIHIAWLACNPGKPVPPELHVGPATAEGAPQPDPVRAERNRAYQREYQRRRRSERAPLGAKGTVSEAAQPAKVARQAKLEANRKRRAAPKASPRGEALRRSSPV
jgi:hypothetical protein